MKLKQISIDFGDEARSQNKMLDGVDNDFDSTQNFLKGTMNKLSHMISSGGSKHMCYLVAFIFAIFVFVYYLVR
jgi:blocked-early-in-transport protein 1